MESLKCPICLELATPVLSFEACMHKVCKADGIRLGWVANASRAVQCPTCRTSSPLREDHAVTQMLEELMRSGTLGVAPTEPLTVQQAVAPPPVDPVTEILDALEHILPPAASTLPSVRQTVARLLASGVTRRSHIADAVMTLLEKEELRRKQQQQHVQQQQTNAAAVAVPRSLPTGITAVAPPQFSSRPRVPAAEGGSTLHQLHGIRAVAAAPAPATPAAPTRAHHGLTSIVVEGVPWLVSDLESTKALDYVAAHPGAEAKWCRHHHRAGQQCRHGLQCKFAHRRLNSMTQ